MKMFFAGFALGAFVMVLVMEVTRKSPHEGTIEIVLDSKNSRVIAVRNNGPIAITNLNFEALK
jgi:hypothetical protein